MIKDDKVFFNHILECIKYVKAYTKKLDEKSFYKLVPTQDAVFRRIEIIGEAAKNVSKKFKEAHPEIEWSKIIGMRNMLIHEYFNIDLKLTWKTTQKDIPELEKIIKKLLK
jgi:uncharacterized protein with HEPN domain